MAVNVTIEDDRSERSPAVFAVPDGCRIVIRRCADGADVLVVPDPDPCLPPASVIPAGTALRVATWGIIAREDDQSFLLRLQDSRGRDHDFIVSSVDIAGIGMAAQAVVGRDFSYEAARTRKMVAEAERVELENAALRRPSDDQPLQADRWTVASDSERGTVTATACDPQGREVRVESTPDRARWLAEHLLSGARHVEVSRGDRALAEEVRRRCEAAEPFAREV